MHIVIIVCQTLENALIAQDDDADDDDDALVFSLIANDYDGMCRFT